MNKATEVRRNPNTGVAYHARNVLCSDGRYRTCLLGEPDTYFTCPASTIVGRKYVKGYVSSRPDNLHPNNLCFTAYANHKNASVLPEWAYVDNDIMVNYPVPKVWMNNWEEYQRTMRQISKSTEVPISHDHH